MNRPSFSTVVLILLVSFGAYHWWNKQHAQTLIAQNDSTQDMDSVRANNAARQGREVIHLYTATWCGYCKHLKASLDASGAPYLDHDVENSVEGKRYAEENHISGVPVTVVGHETVDGLDVDRLQSVFYHAGYDVKGLEM
ncbi:glutaredoxin family protein [Aquirhabdus parva]|uniref:Glutaredoxin domain-containing protein n=1 Tax=Aquirhabdus parva TaxID=2283318 RepID=A0A345P3T0_9GAMM|nr:glutaredoxin domain-containing protein [Aquirhabdus parva]AXI01939.1 hypothetical protein HYN46_03070 [Aquirhabdus parva]